MSRPHLRFHRLLLWLLGGALVLALLVWGAGIWAARQARVTLNERLAKRGLTLVSQKESWSPWHGVTLEGAELRRTRAGNERVVAITALHADVEWAASWKARHLVTLWHAQDATLTVQDAEGSVTLEHFTADLVAQDGQVTLQRLNLRDGPVSYELAGKILTSAPESAPPQGDFQLRLKPLRGMLKTLHFTTEGQGEFKVTGRFKLDAREEPVKWNASLHGKGHDVAWHTVTLRQVQNEARLSNAGLDATNTLEFLEGAGEVAVTREGWSQTPLNLKGVLTDAAGRKDEFNGAYQTAERTLKIAELSGKADLLEMLRNVPALADKLPRTVKVKTFPQLTIRDLVCAWQKPGAPPVWSIGNAQLRSPADVVVTVQGHALNVADITGSVACEDHVWHIRQAKGKLLGGAFGLEGSYDGRALRNAEIALESLNLSRLSPWAGKISGKLDKSELTMKYRGTICGREPKLSTGSGSVVLTNAPVVHIPVLDQAYSLFPKVLPHKGSDGTGELQASFVMTKGVAAVNSLKARSESVVVTGSGTVDLVRRQVDGKARANLRGLVGVVTSPLSHVLMDMEIEGPLNNVRISPQGPIGAAKTAVKAATGGAKFSSKVVGTGLTLPFYALGMLDGERDAGE